MVDIDDKICPCCRGELHRIGEDKSERLDMVPARSGSLSLADPNTPADRARTASCRLRPQPG